MNKYSKFSKAKFGAQQCGHTKPKVKYDSEEKAKLAVEQLKDIGVRGCYKCGVCGNWHVTSKTTEE